MTIMPEVVRVCRESGIPDTPVIVGGIIPEQDHQPLHDVGIAGVFNPGTPMSKIIESVSELATKRRAARRQEAGKPAIDTTPGLARAITMLIDGDSGLEAFPAPSAPGLCVGVTGAPGVG